MRHVRALLYVGSVVYAITAIVCVYFSGSANWRRRTTASTKAQPGLFDNVDVF